MVKRFKALTETAAYHELSDLAKSPFDLTATNALQNSRRMSRYICRSSLIDLHYGTQRLDDQVLAAMQKLADELQLVEQFQMMRRGATLNNIEGIESETRQVLHTACRDLFTSAPAEPSATGDAKKELARLQEFLEDIDSGVLRNHRGERFDTMVHVGIGGSDLGPRSIYEALREFRVAGRKVHFIANVDPDDAARVLTEVDLDRALVTIVSKSGTTLETLTNEQLVRNALLQRGLDPATHCVSVTGAGSPMDNPSNYLRSFLMYDYIGGRFSSTSMVGAVMLGFAIGYSSLMEFLEGAATVDWLAEEPQLRENIPLLMALIGIWNRNFLGHATLAILPYSQPLNRFPAHLQQCDMESNGKSIDRFGEVVPYSTGPIIWGEPGTNGQHAFYQLLHQGTIVVPADFIGFKLAQGDHDLVVQGSTSQQKLIANLLAQVVALAVGQVSENPNRNFPGNRPSSLLMAEKLSPKVMGALLALYEAKIVFQGFTWNINSFDQEGVQLGKQLATTFLEAMNQGSESLESLAHTFLNQL
ncbi:MAG: glucose-6-phosphate isomerase [Desulforhopalus sp.]